jgi:hypothetical protein
MKTASQAIEFFQAAGFHAFEREWVIGKSIGVAADPSEHHGIQLWRRLVYIASTNDGWVLHNPRTPAEGPLLVGSLEQACHEAIAALNAWDSPEGHLPPDLSSGASVQPMETPPAPSLFAVLSRIERRPGMYLREEESGCSSLNDLEALIRGYGIAAREHQMKDEGLDLYSQFSDYLHQRYGWSMCRGPIMAIKDASSSDSDAWNRFWRLLREFRESRGDGGGY